MAYANRSQEDEARTYCVSLGIDPDELVGGYMPGFGRAIWVRQARWRFYLGVSEAGLRRPI